ncbi:hypothetical protein DB345_02155 [Spartobacteria bacterium LR76]|nr:hypothetical protein DB345_02155 [Spartobacteria bacterium LR76]
MKSPYRNSPCLAVILCATLTTLLLPKDAFSQTTYTWSGGGADQLWSNSANWSGGTAPAGASGSTDAIVLGLTTGATAPVVDAHSPWYLQTLSFLSGAGNVTLTGNDLNFTSTTVVSTTVINANVAGTFSHSIANNITLANWNVIRSGTQSGGNLTLTGNITSGSGSNTIVFRGVGNASSVTGVIGGSSTSKVNVQKFDSGTWTFSNASNRIASFIAGGGKTVIGGNNALGDGVVLSIGNTSGIGNIQVDLNGYSQRLGGLTGVTNDNASNREIVTNSSATLSTLTYERTTATGNQTFGGQITGNIALVKRGSNTLTLTADGIHANSGENTYTGSTTIAEGTLLLSGGAVLSNTSAITVDSGAVFDVSQTTSGFTVKATQSIGGAGKVLSTSKTLTLNGALKPSGTLTVDGGALALGSSATFTFTLGTTSDSILLTNGATLALGSGTLGFSDFAFTTGAGFASGTYVLISGASSLTGSLDAANLTGSLGSYTGTLAIDGSNLVLNVVPEPGSTALVALGSLLVIVIRRRHSVA